MLKTPVQVQFYYSATRDEETEARKVKQLPQS